MADETVNVAFTGSSNQSVQVAQLFGNINSSHHHHATAASAINTVTKVYDVPDLLSPNFLGRENELAEIQDALEKSRGESPARCIIHGMHGLGKTQLALKYAEIVWKEERHQFVFWISASSVDKVVAGFSKILDLISLTGRESLDQSARCLAALSWLADAASPEARKWLLILDNVNEEVVATLRQVLPRSNSRGQILLTTRTRPVTQALADAFGEHHASIGLGPLEVDQSVQLLLRSSAISQDRQRYDEMQAAKRIVKSVGCLPLAVDQAASRMEEFGITFEEMAQDYKDKQVESTLEWENDLSRYEERSIVATYASTLKKLEKSPLGTVELLRILAFLDPESIPIEMLKNGCRDLCKPTETQHGAQTAKPKKSSRLKRLVHGYLPEKLPALSPPVITEPADEDLGKLRNLLWSPVNLQKATHLLQRLLLVTQRREGMVTMLRIHDLVQLVLRSQLMNNAVERRRWLGLATKIVCESFSEIEDPNLPTCWDDCERYVAHVEALQRLCEVYEVIYGDLLNMCFDIASYLRSRGRYKEAGNLNIYVLEKEKILFGENNPRTLGTMVNLAASYKSQGQYEESEKLIVHVLESRKKLLGEKHALTLDAMSSLALAYQGLRRFKDAEGLGLQTLKLQDETLGTEHPDTLASRGTVASIYQRQGRYEEAEELQVEVLEQSRKVQGNEHPYTLICMSSLARTLRFRGKDAKAMELMEECAQLRKRILGPDHPRTVNATKALARWKNEAKK